VFEHPGFVRSCCGARPVGGTFLHVAAFDLARGPDGCWRVAASRLQAPSGAGYALENRTTVSRVFPDAFHALQVQAITPFFDSLQRLILAHAPADGSVPRAALLTPGPFNETYFEHAYLSRHLGFPLVEGGDLTVRGDRLYLKTVSGLDRVHAILRRVDDDYCDPLELRADSTLGVPGLLQAWRAGQVLIANALGAGVLESSALCPYLERTCQRLLGEPLAVRSIDERRAADSCTHVDDALPLSHAPVWHGGRLAPRAIMLRVFLVSDGAGGYRAMPGGLVRLAAQEGQTVSGQRGGGSKDLWVVGSATSSNQGIASTDRAGGAEDQLHERPTSSRTAEHLFWLGRYAERSENCARLIRASLLRYAEAGSLSLRMERLFVASGRTHGLLRHADPQEEDGGFRWDGAQALMESLEERHTGLGLGFNIDQTIRVASAVRDRLSSDNWRILRRLSDQFDSETMTVRVRTLDEALESIDQAILSLVAIGGLEMAHMTRNDGWRFLTMGRHLERLWFVATTLAEIGGAAATEDPAALEWLLELSDSLITYRARHARHPEWRPVVDLLLLDERNPRSAAFQLVKLTKHLHLLPDANLVAIRDEVDRLARACREADLVQGDLFGGPPPIDGLVADSRQLAIRIGETLTLQFFNNVYERPHATVAL
jgi:uncharacterized alpha-E superfamily protein